MMQKYFFRDIYKSQSCEHHFAACSRRFCLIRNHLEARTLPIFSSLFDRLHGSLPGTWYGLYPFVSWTCRIQHTAQYPPPPDVSYLQGI